jgi:hypothetical protein
LIFDFLKPFTLALFLLFGTVVSFSPTMSYAISLDDEEEDEEDVMDYLQQAKNSANSEEFSKAKRLLKQAETYGILSSDIQEVEAYIDTKQKAYDDRVEKERLAKEQAKKEERERQARAEQQESYSSSSSSSWSSSSSYGDYFARRDALEKECKPVQQQCEDNCEWMTGTYMLNETNQAACRSKCCEAYRECMEEDFDDMKVAICRSQCVMADGGSVLSIHASERQKCNRRCFDKFH